MRPAQASAAAFGTTQPPATTPAPPPSSHPSVPAPVIPSLRPRPCPSPRSAFLSTLPEIVVKGGLVVFISPYSWLKQYTRDQSKWLGGFTDSKGARVESFPELKKIMHGLKFELVRQGDEPFVIREHRRKFQWGCSHLTVWRNAA